MEIKDNAGFVGTLNEDQKAYFAKAFTVPNEIKDDAVFLGTLNDVQKGYFYKAVKGAREGWIQKPVAPEKYEFKFKNESPLDPSEDAAKIADYAKSRGFTAEDAQTLADLLQDRAIALTQRQQAAITREVETWKTAANSDKDRNATETNVKRVLERFAKTGSEERKFLEESGILFNPHIRKMFNSFGKAMAEGGHTEQSEGGGGEGPATLAEALYGKKSA